MANWYVWSGATGGGTGADWSNAYTTLEAPAAAKAAGDTFFVAHDHVEIAGAAKVLSFAGTLANPNRVYCVNRSGSVPPVAADLRTTAQIGTTGAFSLSMSGSMAECYGIIFSAGTGSVSCNLSIATAAGNFWRLVNCALSLGTTNTASRMAIPSAASNGTGVVLENTTMQFGNTSQLVQLNGRFVWRNTPNAIQGATLPTSLLSTSASNIALLEGVDLSALASGKTLFVAPTTVNQVVIKDCKLGASVTIIGTPLSFSGQADIIRSDSGDSNYRTERYGYAGTQTTETTIVRTGGATDGTTAVAWKLVTTANAKPEFPFECLPISIWNETVGSSVTATVQGIWGGGAVPLNDDIWIDVEYLGTSGFPLAVKATSGKASGLATGASNPGGSGTWGGSTTSFAMSATFTPTKKGVLTIYVRAGKASSTFYVDPKPVVT